ncbi:hypothetical protein NDU88_001481 [Pleurodeles waltl]|uniref:Uncharacterized protein n=1 Tax=Pleurodeles waltl TaxID=8319 RepID=A0AAV7LZF7_PLEWA|nr:hypothetical protein NDU88_001481 [Pleurodeles waltl]
MQCCRGAPPGEQSPRREWKRAGGACGDRSELPADSAWNNREEPGLLTTWLGHRFPGRADLEGHQQRPEYFARQDAACPRCSSVDADLLYMIWSWGSLHRFWKAVVDCLSECTARRVPFNWKVCVLGLFPRVDPPAEQAWKQSFGVWAAAEGVALRQEDALGLRQHPLSDRRGELEACLRAGCRGLDVDKSD